MNRFFVNDGGAHLMFFHGFFMLLLLVGIVFLCIWAAKNLKEKQLKIATIVLILVGLIGCYFTLDRAFDALEKAPFGGYNMMYGYGRGGMMQWQGQFGQDDQGVPASRMGITLFGNGSSTQATATKTAGTTTVKTGTKTK